MTDPYAQAANQRTPRAPIGSEDPLATATRALVREELAALGGHLLATYGDELVGDSILTAIPHPLATLGGYLLERYGQKEDAPQ